MDSKCPNQATLDISGQLTDGDLASCRRAVSADSGAWPGSDRDMSILLERRIRSPQVEYPALRTRSTVEKVPCLLCNPPPLDQRFTIHEALNGPSFGLLAASWSGSSKYWRWKRWFLCPGSFAGRLVYRVQQLNCYDTLAYFHSRCFMAAMFTYDVE